MSAAAMTMATAAGNHSGRVAIMARDMVRNTLSSYRQRESV